MIKHLIAPCTHFVINHIIMNIPSRTLRRISLNYYLGSMKSGCCIQRGVRFLNGRKVHLGSRVILNWGTILDGRHYSIIINDNVSIGPCATVLTLGHDPHSLDFANKGGPVTIGKRAWVAYGALILPGIEIGEGAVVGAGAVVSRDVAPYTIVAGNPAREIGKRPKALTYELDYHPWLS